MTGFHIAFKRAIGAVSNMNPTEPEGGYAEGYADAKDEALAIMREAIGEELGELLAELEVKEKIALVPKMRPHGRDIHIFNY